MLANGGRVPTKRSYYFQYTHLRVDIVICRLQSVDIRFSVPITASNTPSHFLLYTMYNHERSVVTDRQAVAS